MIFSKILFSILLLCFTVPITAQNSANSTLEKVTLHLKYKHGFQFAGYYIAQKKGYYSQAGLIVTIKEAIIKESPLKGVLSGVAQYGIGNSSLLNLRLSGKPLVVLAVIFQHSPFIILSRKDAKINKPSDLIGRRLMANKEKLNDQFKAMLIKEGLDPSKIKRLQHTGTVKDIINGHADASASYLTDSPNRMRMLGVEPAIMRPIHYGIDFYGDCLFTSEDEINTHPKRVAAFRQASLKGWEYAMDNVDEIVKLIIKMPGVKERGITTQHLHYEAQQMQKLIFPRLIEIGHSNPDRWRHIADTYVSLGMLKPDYSLEGLVYNPNPIKNYWLFYSLLGLLFGTGMVTIFALIWNKTLKKQVRQRTEKLRTTNEQLKESEAYAKTLFAESATPLVVMNAATYQYSDCNQAAINIYGVHSREELLTKTPLDVSAKIQYDGIDSAIKAKKHITTALEKGWLSLSGGINALQVKSGMEKFNSWPLVKQAIDSSNLVF